MSVIHVTKTGKRIPIRKLEDAHLVNIIKRHHRRANEGIFIGSGIPGDHDTFWGETVYGYDALRELNHGYYVCEAYRRGIALPCSCRCGEEPIWWDEKIYGGG